MASSRQKQVILILGQPSEELRIIVGQVQECALKSYFSVSAEAAPSPPLMDHVPYPLTSNLPDLEIPFLCLSELSRTQHRSEVAPQDIGADNDDVDTEHGSPCARREPRGENIPPSHGHPNAGASAASPGQSLESSVWIDAFWKYPQRRGWINEYPQAQWFLCSNEEAAMRAQEWLYLRLLNSFLGVHVPAHTMTKPSRNTGEPVIDSSILPQLLQGWEFRIRQREKERKPDAPEEPSVEKKADAVLLLLKEVLHQCNNLDEQLEPSRSIAFSIRILVEILTKSIWPLSVDSSVQQWTIWKLGPTPLITDRMAAAGCCRFQIARLWYRYLPSTMYFLSSLPSRSTFGGVIHHTCTADHCTSTAINPATYEPSHRKICITGATPYRDCSMVSVNTDCIADMILQDSFPLIEIQVQANGGIELKVHKYKLGLRYVAISHVWSGGLGNAKANSMRSCQLRYLGHLLCRLRENGDDELDRRHGSRKIDDSIDDFRARFGFARREMPLLLWIDTLCIPVGSEHTVAYKMTLNRMAQIYVTAQCTVVLDPELQTMNHRAMRVEQTYAHILCSSWMSRSWTFQEACMARIWFVQFADGYFAVDKHYIEYRKKYGRLTNIESSKSHETIPAPTTLGIQSVWLMHDLAAWFREMPVLAKIRYGDPRELMSNLEDWQNFAMAWNGLRDRSTTKPEDLYGIIAVVVDLSAGDVLKLRREERLSAIYRSQRTLPLSLLYQTSPKILDQKGQSTWAPAGIVGERLEANSGYVTVGTDGLLIEPTRWGNMNQPQAILLTSASTNNRFLEFEINGTRNRQILELVIDRSSSKLETPKRSLCCIYDAALLRHDGTGTFAPGVCLTVESHDRYCYYTSYMCPVKVFASRISITDASVSTKQITDPNLELLPGTSLDWRKRSVVIKTSKYSITVISGYRPLRKHIYPDPSQILGNGLPLYHMFPRPHYRAGSSSVTLPIGLTFQQLGLFPGHT
ncbi:MAG: hypothetical protein Q9208_008390 [Pyrenodesmia sp. 3 TL-2023]